MHWSISDLTPEQHDRRRQLLNIFGFVSTIFSLLCFISLSVIYSLQRSYWNDDKGSRWLIRWTWWAGQYISNRKPKLGTRGLWISLVAGSGWLVFLSLSNTTEDYLHLTKRFGHIASSLFPILYLLSSKTILQGLSSITGQTYETLNIVHRWVGRCIITLLVLHGAFYINFFIRADRLDRFLYLDVILGLILLAMLLAIFVSSMPSIRQKSYFTFYAIHIVLSTLILPVAWLHVTHLRPYVAITVLIVLTDKITRLCWLTWTTTKVLKVSETLTEMNVDVKGKRYRSVPGQHVTVTVPGINWFRHHPFTIESKVQGRMRLLARTRDNFTKSLSGKIGREMTIWLEAPYGVSGLFPKFEEGFERVIFIAGGVGATFTLPICRNLVGKKEWKDGELRFIWAVKRPEEVEWALKQAPEVGVEIFVSGASKFSLAEDDDTDEDKETTNDDHGIELSDQSQSQALLSSSNEKDDSAEHDLATLNEKYQDANITFTPGRPDIKDLLQEIIQSTKGRVAILVCGPSSLGLSVKTTLDDYGGNVGSRAWFWSEAFGW